MKLSLVRLLLVVNLGLAAGLAWLWFDEAGALRNVHWQAPPPHPVDFGAMLPRLATPDDTDVTRLVATLDRPVFSPSRRPPPPVVVVAPPPPPPPDPLANIQLFGLFSSGESGGILARIDGKMRRVRLNETIGDWAVKTIKDRDVIFARGSETRTIRLTRAGVAALSSAPPAAGPSQASSPQGAERVRATNAPAAAAIARPGAIATGPTFGGAAPPPPRTVP